MIAADVGKHLFNKVKTPDGVGTLVGVEVDWNGRNFFPETARLHVWYGTDNVQGGWVEHGYPLDEVSAAD